MRFVVEVIIFGGGLPGFPKASASVVSMSMSVVQRGVKKLRAITAFGGSLTAADVGTVLIDLLAVC
jgi:hypothetical protein